MPGDCSSILFGMQTTIQRSRRPIPICNWPSVISSVPCLRRPSTFRSSDKLFTRICGVIRDGFSNPDFGPCEVAAETGISLRYVQKLFTERGFACSEYIYSFRLDHAAHLLRRRALLATGQPLSEIAYACGFRDYAHFARKFRHRFGDAPGAHAGRDQTAGDRTVRAGTGESALSAHDARAPAA